MFHALKQVAMDLARYQVDVFGGDFNAASYKAVSSQKWQGQGDGVALFLLRRMVRLIRGQGAVWVNLLFFSGNLTRETWRP